MCKAWVPSLVPKREEVGEKRERKGDGEGEGNGRREGRKHTCAGRWLLKPIILPTQEAEIRRMVVQSQPKQIV
jgi:hypothetical protein